MLTKIWKLFQRLFPAQRILQTLGKTEITEVDGRSDWVLGRGLCHFICIDLNTLPKGERVEALQLRILQRSPYAKTGSFVVWHRGYAQVWFWNKEIWQAECERLVVDISTPVYPESLLYPARQGDEVLLRPCLEGFEGQCWIGGFLQTSRWWSKRPTPLQWSNFLRSAGKKPESIYEEIEGEGLMNKPWASSSSLSQTIEHRYEPVIIKSAMLMFTAILGWQGTMIWKWTVAEQQLIEQADAMSNQIEPLLTARQQAITVSRLVERYQQLSLYPTQLELHEEVLKRLIKMGNIRLMSWHYTWGRLSIIIQGVGLDPSRVVRDLQLVPWFHEVGVVPGKMPQQLEISVELKPRGSVL